MNTQQFALITLLLLAIPASSSLASIAFNRDFAPHEGLVAPVEKPFRGEICLNGLWQFQPAEGKQATDAQAGPPEPASPKDEAWDKVPIRIPSPWNVNSFSAKDGGDFHCYPSYPKSWEAAKAGWMRRTFRVPSEWAGKRIVVHFEAVGGCCWVYVNGKQVAKHTDAFMPFDVDITGLAKMDADNEILVGAVHPDLFAVQGKHGSIVSASGSFWGEHVGGIWQDVYLHATPKTGIDNVFVQPCVDRDALDVDVSIRAAAGNAGKLKVAAKVYQWISGTGKDVLSAPEVKWKLGDKPVLEMNGVDCEAGKNVVISAKVNGKLDLWSPDSPKLYGLVVEVTEDGKVVDRQYVRFGWRQFGISGTNLTLNGKPIQAKGDAWHFMGIPQMTRRYAWSWFTALKDANANAVRLHAQPYPRFYMEVADEVGMMILDESAIWASHCAYNYDEPVIWDRFTSNVLDLVLRDRNHPSVFGWSVANEINGALGAKNAPEDYANNARENIGKIAKQVKALDPTRPWISSDGDQDLGGRLPVSINHYAGMDFCEVASSKGKPVGIGEGGMGYYGTPKQVARYNGDRAYESQEGRMEGLAYEAYDQIARGQRQWAAYCSVFNLAWYALKPLPIGLPDTTRPPQPTDGIVFGKYVEGKPGVQPERLGPYCSTFNPGYDPKLPLYETWPMFEAIKAAYAPGRPADCKWAHMPKLPTEKPVFDGKIDHVTFIGDDSGQLRFSLYRVGAPVAGVEALKDDSRLMVIEGSSLTADRAQAVKKLANGVTESGGTVLIWGVTKDSLSAINALLPAPVQLTERQAISLVGHGKNPVTKSIALADMYFAESSSGKTILEAGLGGPFVEKGKVLLEACNTDWQRWNDRGENVKTASVLRSEMEAKPSGAALVEMPVGKGRMIVCNIQPTAFTATHVALIQGLMGGLGVKLQEPKVAAGGALDASGSLREALAIGGFQGSSHDNALDTDFLGAEVSIAPKSGDKVGDLAWAKHAANDDGIFDLLKLGTPESKENCAAYLSFWIYSPRPLDELLAQPDVPKVGMVFGSDDGAKAWLNGKQLFENRSQAPLEANQHSRSALALKKGWNHFLIKIGQGGGQWQFSARFTSSDPRFLAELQSSVEPVAAP